ncbi:protease complex subunit PrcB family protein [Flavobacterium sp.]|uniref:protease complex subunit PrcB family protein n=1 Tax=Flavobacterium sp. TaxID=239 RepID=UPI00286E9BEE|nr:protease complex subunit PrcB family protein [Flavobacterium sp.]
MNKLTLLFCFLFLTSCGVLIPNKDEKNISNAFEVIYKSNFSGVPSKSYRVVRNNEDYRAFFISMGEDKIPDVDFVTHNVLILNFGQRKTGGYEVIPEKLIDDTTNLIMIVKEIYPKKGDMVTTAMSSPICIVKIKSKKDIVIK